MSPQLTGNKLWRSAHLSKTKFQPLTLPSSDITATGCAMNRNPAGALYGLSAQISPRKTCAAVSSHLATPRSCMFMVHPHLHVRLPLPWTGCSYGPGRTHRSDIARQRGFSRIACINRSMTHQRELVKVAECVPHV